MLLSGVLAGLACMGLGLVPWTISNIVFAALSGLLAAAGDLIESKGKRAIGYIRLKDGSMKNFKDSHDVLKQSRIVGFIERRFAGHGGAADRMDSAALALIGLLLIKVVTQIIFGV